MGTEGRVWVCIVCGYVHRGSQPPDTCPVCGASREDFEAATESAPAAPRASSKRWRCLICGYVHDGDEPPEECPVCGASRDDFEAIEEAPITSQHRAARVVVAGAGIAGVSAVEILRETSPSAEILLVSKEAHLPYYRLNLTRYLAGEIDESALAIHPEDWYAQRRITLIRNAEVTAILTQSREVEITGGRKERFDKLILTSGAHPFVPPISGASLSGVHTVRTLEDADAILAAAKSRPECVCIGGGILGLETAGALARRGVHVTLLESYEWLLPRQLNRAAGKVLHKYVADAGIEVRYEAQTAEITGETKATGVALKDGSQLPGELVLITTGVRPNTALARKAGLEVNRGIVVDARLATSNPHVFAAGDVAEHRGTLYGLWEPARYQGTIAAMNALGSDTEFGGLPRANTLKVLGVDLFSAGVVTPEDGSYTAVTEDTGQTFANFLFRDHRMVGAILVGDTHAAAAAMKLIKNGLDCSALLAKAPSADQVRRFLGRI